MKVIYNQSSNKSGIYVIYCTANFGLYVGSTIVFKRRRVDHLRELRNNKHHCKHLQNAWNKHGEAFFVFQVIEVTSKEERYDIEQRYLDRHFGKSYCYNSRSSAKFTPSNEQNKERLKTIYGRVKSEKERQSISESLKNKTTINWKNRKYTDPRIIYGVDTLLEKGLFPRAISFTPDEIPYLTQEARAAYKSFPYYVVHNPSKTSERTQLKRDFKLWLEYQGIWIDKRQDSWSRKSDSDKDIALQILHNGRTRREDLQALLIPGASI